MHVLNCSLVYYIIAPKCIKMFVLDEADEMLSRGFKDQIYEIFQKLSTNIQVGLLFIYTRNMYTYTHTCKVLVSWAEMKRSQKMTILKACVSNVVHKFVYIPVSEHFSFAKLIHPPDRCCISRSWLTGMQTSRLSAKCIVLNPKRVTYVICVDQMKKGSANCSRNRIQHVTEETTNLLVTASACVLERPRQVERQFAR